MPYFEDIRMDIDDPELIEIHDKFFRWMQNAQDRQAYRTARNWNQHVYDEHNKRIQDDPDYVYTVKYRVIERCLVRYWRSTDELYAMKQQENKQRHALNEDREKLNKLQTEYNALYEDYNNLIDQYNSIAHSSPSIVQSAQNNLSPLMRWVVAQRASSDLMEYGLTGKLPNRG